MDATPPPLPASPKKMPRRKKNVKVSPSKPMKCAPGKTSGKPSPSKFSPSLAPAPATESLPVAGAGASAGGSLSGTWRAKYTASEAGGEDGGEVTFELCHDVATGVITGGHVEGSSNFFLVRDGLLTADALSFVQQPAAGAMVHWEATVRWLGEVPTLCRGCLRGSRAGAFTAVLLHGVQSPRDASPSSQ